MMARIVKELEDEATSRVRMLEDKLRQTSKSAYEVSCENKKKVFRAVFCVRSSFFASSEIIELLPDPSFPSKNKWRVI